MKQPGGGSIEQGAGGAGAERETGADVDAALEIVGRLEGLADDLKVLLKN